MNPPSTATKAYVSALIAICAAIGGTFADTGVGKVCVVLAAGLTAYLGVFKARNTDVITTGPGDGPVIVGEVVSSTGEKVGEVIADTGTAVGGVVAGTTGVVGQVLDATVGKLLPSGGGKHS